MHKLILGGMYQIGQGVPQDVRRDGRCGSPAWPSAYGVSAPKNMEKQLRMASGQRRMPDNTLKLYQLGHTAPMGTEMGTKHHSR